MSGQGGSKFIKDSGKSLISDDNGTSSEDKQEHMTEMKNLNKEDDD